ncbi:hypothetical protein D3C76_330570 [compost metagenome]
MVGKVPALLSLGVTFGLLLGGVVVSLVKTRGDKATVEAKLQHLPPEKSDDEQKEKDPQLRV